MRVAGGVHRPLVEDDGKLDQKIGQLARQCRDRPGGAAERQEPFRWPVSLVTGGQSVIFGSSPCLTRSVRAKGEHVGGKF
jgi:hypothetical protein